VLNARRLFLLFSLLLAAGCSDEGSGVEFQIKRDACKASCTVDRFDLFVLQGSCVYAWRVGVGPKEQILGEVAARDDQVTVLVLGRCGAESCPRCAGQTRLTVGASARVDIPLQPVAGCVVPGRTTLPCTRCLPGPDAYCDGRHRVTCTASGETRREACAQFCVDGRCEKDCPKKVYYDDDDGDTYGDGADQTEACTRPAGHVERGGDCDDDDHRAHPGQTAFFAEPTKGNGDFDYNCDNVEEKRYPNLDDGCFSGKNGSCGEGGWLTRSVPDCGAEAPFLPCVKDPILGCKPAGFFRRKQPCR
jgi:hypothetical protein